MMLRPPGGAVAGHGVSALLRGRPVYDAVRLSSRAASSMASTPTPTSMRMLSAHRLAPTVRGRAAPSMARWSSSMSRSSTVCRSSTTPRSTLSHTAAIRSLYHPSTLHLLPPPLRRSLHTRPLPTRGPVFRFVYRFFAYAGAFMLVSGGLVVAFFIYDATTYTETTEIEELSVNAHALDPPRGGPKNLPIADILVDDEDCDAAQRQRDKPRLVILGSGWGSVALLKTLNPDDYHITVVSPVNYFLFTPMLPSATVGTVELRSLVEPVRRVVKRVNGHFLKAEAVDVELGEQLLEVSQTGTDGVTRNFYLPYDKLVIGVGSTSNPHGVKGLEHTLFLKSVKDAQMIRYKVLENMEKACLPTTSDEERRRLLSFVICGGGPTGVEFAAELADLLHEDLGRSFPRLLINEVSIHVIQSRGHILNTYDEALSEYAEKRFAKDEVDVLTNARVKEVQADKILFTQKGEKGEIVTKELPMGFCLWSTGVSQTDFCAKLAAKLGAAQTNKHALETDTHLRLNGAPLGTVYAIGDCSTVQNNVADHLVHFLRAIAVDRGLDPEHLQLTFSEWRKVAGKVRRQFPQAGDHLRRVDKLFAEYDKDRSGTLDFGELRMLLTEIDRRLTSLPATAQRAHQQGQYLGKKLRAVARTSDAFAANEMRDGDLDDAVAKPFQYRHLGSLAYIGNAAVFDFGSPSASFAGGVLAVYLWRSIYFAQSVSFRTRVMLAMDWAKRALFGRDLMNF